MFSILEGVLSEWICEVISDPTEESWNNQEGPNAPEGSREGTRTSETLSPTEQDTDGSEDTNRTSPPPPDSDHANTNSSLNADEADEDKRVSETSQQQGGMLGLSCKVFHHSCSVMAETEQKEALLPQRPCELTPRGEIQEAAQQVFHQGPLCAVAMEPSSRGGDASRGVAAMRERLGRVGETTTRENQQPGEEEGQNDQDTSR